MKQLTSFLLIVIMFTLSGCGQNGTPEAVAQRYIVDNAPRTNNAPAQLEDVQIHRTQSGKNGVLALYTAQDASSAPSEQVGYIMLEKSLLNWQPKETGAIVRPASVASTGLVEYEVGGGRVRNADYALVFGRVLDPQVVAVEATFDNNQVLRDERTDDVFAILADGANAVCEVRLLASDDTVLERSVPSSAQQQCTP